MKGLKSLLVEFSEADRQERGQMGGGPVDETKSGALDKRQWDLLRQRLRKTIADDKIWLYAYGGMVGAAFTAAVAIVFSQPDTAIYVLPASGGLLAFLIGQMRSMWREQVATSMLLEFSMQLKGDVLATIIDILSDWMKRGGKTRS